MQAVQKIKCINNAWFVLSCEAADGNGRSLSSDDLPIRRESVLDLAECNFHEGAEVALLVKAVMGKPREAREKLQFARNERTAVFEVKGTSLDFSIQLVAVKGGDDPG